MPVTSDVLYNSMWLADQAYRNNFTQSDNVTGGLGNNGWRILS